MADSNITKRALAAALKELMCEQPFEKINIAQICDRCDMNRKSFYYHFKDKYDLANWIFDTEFISFALKNVEATTWEQRFDSLKPCCEYFYQNRNFYRHLLKVKGQNSFSEHFREFMLPLLRNRLENEFADKSVDDFTLFFYTDAVFCAFERWIDDKDCLPPDTFLDKLKKILVNSASAIHRIGIESGEI